MNRGGRKGSRNPLARPSRMDEFKVRSQKKRKGSKPNRASKEGRESAAAAASNSQRSHALQGSLCMHVAFGSSAGGWSCPYAAHGSWTHVYCPLIQLPPAASGPASELFRPDPGQTRGTGPRPNPFHVQPVSPTLPPCTRNATPTSTTAPPPPPIAHAQPAGCRSAIAWRTGHWTRPTCAYSDARAGGVVLRKTCRSASARPRAWAVPPASLRHVSSTHAPPPPHGPHKLEPEATKRQPARVPVGTVASIVPMVVRGPQSAG